MKGRGSASGWKSRLASLGAMFGAPALLLIALNAAHLAFNVSDSMPIGLYHVEPVRGPVRAGDIVEVCPPTDADQLAVARHYLLRNGPCSRGSIYLLKIVAAVGGDFVEARDDAIIVNGKALPNSRTLAVDRAGRSLPHVERRTYHLAPGQLWLWTPNPRSWDSRYYGPVPVANVAGLEHLLLAVTPWPYWNARS
jgi:conjugative transfer signal peptidase TraF